MRVFYAYIRPFVFFQCLMVLPSGVKALPLPEQSLQVGEVSLPIWQRNDRSGTLKGSVLLVLGAGEAGAWPHSLATLAESLPNHGWNTLAIRADLSMPDLADLDARVNAALDHLRADSGSTIVVVAAESLARKVALQSVSQGFSKNPSAFVLLNRPEMDTPENERKFHQQKLAVLELYTELPASIPLWRERRYLAAEYQHSSYQQMKLPLAGPNWSGQPDRLVKKISGWLKRSYP